jgi:hypothetical protein
MSGLDEQENNNKTATKKNRTDKYMESIFIGTLMKSVKKKKKKRLMNTK